MPSYAYVAVAANGKEKRGSLEAANPEKIRQVLKAEGLIPVSVKEQSTMTRDIDFSALKKVKPRDLGVFCRQFGSILNAGVTVIQALEMLSEQTENKKLAKAIKDTKLNVEKGESLAGAMRASKGVFPNILINMVDAGEASGSLDVAFDRMATHFEKTSRIQSLVRKAMIYPIVLVLVAVVVIVVMSVYVVPRFANMFGELGSDMPAITLSVLALSNFMIHRWYILVALIVILIVAYKLFTSTETGKMFFGRLAIKAPIFGKLNVKNAAASMARTLSTLTSAGLSISSAIDITAKSMNNILYKKALEKARLEVERGIPLSEPLRKSGVFPPMVCHMTKIGEETGNVEGMLTKVADYYEEEVEITTSGLAALMEPLIIVVMGAIVGYLVLALYMPMIDMYGGLNGLG